MKKLQVQGVHHVTIVGSTKQSAVGRLLMQAPARLRERGIDFIQRDRGFMDSIYLHDPNGLKVELACACLTRRHSEQTGWSTDATLRLASGRKK